MEGAKYKEEAVDGLCEKKLLLSKDVSDDEIHELEMTKVLQNMLKLKAEAYQYTLLSATYPSSGLDFYYRIHEKHKSCVANHERLILKMKELYKDMEPDLFVRCSDYARKGCERVLFDC